MRLGVSPATSTPKAFSISGLRFYFPSLEPWGCSVCFAPTPFLLVYLCANMGLPSLPAAAWRDPPAPPCPPHSTICHLAGSSSHHLSVSVSAPPTSLDECVLFNSLVVGLPYNSIFCQFWFFFVFKLLLSFVWLCKEAQCLYLRLHLGRMSQH